MSTYGLHMHEHTGACTLSHVYLHTFVHTHAHHTDGHTHTKKTNLLKVKKAKHGYSLLPLVTVTGTLYFREPLLQTDMEDGLPVF